MIPRRHSDPLLRLVESFFRDYLQQARGVSRHTVLAYRDALRRLLDLEQFDRVIVSAGNGSGRGLDNEDLEWLLDRVPAEVLILRPAPDDERRITAEAVRGHF